MLNLKKRGPGRRAAHVRGKTGVKIGRLLARS
jgi:hypothetical protein